MSAGETPGGCGAVAVSCQPFGCNHGLETPYLAFLWFWVLFLLFLVFLLLPSSSSFPPDVRQW